jgi:hypothetical protein
MPRPLRQARRLVEEWTVIERGAPAERRVFEPAAHDLRARNRLGQLGKLSLGDRPQLLRRGVVPISS